jgi:hypothetical protein
MCMCSVRRYCLINVERFSRGYTGHGAVRYGWVQYGTVWKGGYDTVQYTRLRYGTVGNSREGYSTAAISRAIRYPLSTIRYPLALVSPGQRDVKE